MRGAWCIVFAIAGCYAPSPVEGLPCAEGGLCPAGLECGPDFTCVAEVVDAPEAVADGAPDGASVDAPADLPDAPPDACAPCPGVVARYRFDGTFTDSVGTAHGMAVGTGVTFVTGAPGKGEAMHVPAAGGAWVRVPDVAAFDIPSGSVRVSFLIGPDAPAGDLGLVSRDANGTTTNGHFNIRVGHDRRVVVRIQQLSTPTVQAYRCTAAPVTAAAWHEVEVAFGPGGLRMDVDGAEATGASWTDASGATHDCTTAWTGGIDGNDNPWVFGGLTVTAIEGTGAPVTAVAGDVSIDEVRLEVQ